MAEPNYDVVVKVLRNYKAIGESEAKLFARLMERQNFTIENVKTILKELKEKKANSRAYQLLDSLKKNELIDEIKKSNPKTYRPVHPRIILKEIKKEHENFEDAFGVIEQAYETYAESKNNMSGCIEIFPTKAMMMSKIQELIGTGFEIKKIVSNENFMSNLIKNVSDKNYSTKCIEGKTNYAIFEKNGEKVIFAVLNIESIRGSSAKEGVFISDSNFASCLL